MAIGFNRNSGRYIDLTTGRFIPRDLVFGELNADVERFRVRAERLASQLTDGKISTTTYSRLIRESLKPLITRGTALGAGGMEQLQGRQLSQLGNNARRAYGSLKVLSDQIKSGELTPKQIAERSQRLANYAYQGFHRAEQLSRAEGGFTMGLRRLGFGVKHCPDCPGYETADWVPIEQIVPVGSGCVCGGRCKCTIAYRKGTRLEEGLSGSLIDRVVGAQEAVMADAPTV